MLPKTQPTQDQLSTNALKLRGPGAKKAILVQCYNVFVLAKSQRKQGQLSTKALQIKGSRAQKELNGLYKVFRFPQRSRRRTNARPRPGQGPTKARPRPDQGPYGTGGGGA